MFVGGGPEYRLFNAYGYADDLQRSLALLPALFITANADLLLSGAPTLMAHLFAALILGAFGLFLYYLRIRLLQNSVAHHHGCELPPKRFSRDPILWIDLKAQDAKVAKAFQSLPAGAALFRQYGQTFRTTTLFSTVLKTMNAENIHTVYTLNAKDWGVQPFRLAAMRPFCGLGFITTDGLVWEHSRALLKPSFHKSIISDLTDFESSIKHFLSRIPKDGSTTDLQPLLSLLVSLLHDFTIQYLLSAYLFSVCQYFD